MVRTQEAGEEFCGVTEQLVVPIGRGFLEVIYGWDDRGMEGGVLDIVMGREIDRGGSSGSPGGGVGRKRMGIAGDVRERVIS